MEPYYVNQTGTLEQHKAFVAKVMAEGPYQPNTVEHLKTEHVMCPDGTIKYCLSPEEAVNLCFRFNVAFMKGQEKQSKLIEDLKAYIAQMEKSFEPHETHDEEKYQCGICDAYCDIRQKIEQLEAQ